MMRPFHFDLPISGENRTRMFTLFHPEFNRNSCSSPLLAEIFEAKIKKLMLDGLPGVCKLPPLMLIAAQVLVLVTVVGVTRDAAGACCC